MIPTSPLIECQDLASLDPASYRVIETDRSRDDFDAGHIPGSIFWPMMEFFTPHFQLRTDPAHYAELFSRAGIASDTIVVCSYNGNPSMAGWSAWLFWILTSLGHRNTYILNGGTPKWKALGLPLEQEEVEVPAAHYPVPAAFCDGERASLNQVKKAVAAAILDARSLQEFHGEHFFDAPPQPGERAGHIPNALHVPYEIFIHNDGTYRPVEELKAVCDDMGLDSIQQTITYCAAGIRSAVVWFGLKHLLKFSDVRNYDGSWNEWSRVEA
jgi:thiosulfate/3-mercaptopyruvate sulfurtransferase